MSKHRRWTAWWFWPVATAIVLALQMWFPELGDNILHDTYSRTPEGQLAFYRLVSDQAEWAERSTLPLPRLLPDHVADTLCLLGPERWPTDAEWDAVLDWVESGGRLVVAFRGLQERSIPRVDVRYLPRDAWPPPNDSLPPRTSLVSGQTTAWWSDGHLLAPGKEALLTYSDQTQVVAFNWGQGRIVASASALVFSNQLLTYGDNPVLAYRLLEQAGDVWGVTFDESLNKSGTPKTVALLFDDELRPMTLQLILLLVLYGWWNTRRFGPLIPAKVSARHDIVEHADALGAAYWRVGDGSAVLRRYLTALKAALPKHAAATERTAGLALAAQRMGRIVTEVAADLATAEAAAALPRLRRREAAKHIRRLAPLRRALGNTG